MRLSFKSRVIKKLIAAGHHRHAVSSFLVHIEGFVVKEEHVSSIAYLDLSYLTCSSNPLHLTTSETCLSVFILIHCLHDRLGFSALGNTLKHGSGSRIFSLSCKEPGFVSDMSIPLLCCPV